MSSEDAEHLDVVIVGAGLSGIGAAYRLQTECPGRTFAVLEARDVMGGTWDLFRYPGVRSDSDMFTLGYQFRPWQAEKSIADGPTILGYIHDTADEFGIEQHIRYRTKVVGADWSSDDARWTLQLETPEGPHTQTCDFLYSCCGYYDYDRAYTPELPGIETFAGEVVHPQFWPEHLEYAGKRVVVIGSGATAVTLVPAMAPKAAHVTMLQRSPTWIGSVPERDAVADRLRERLPTKVAHRVIRTKNIVFMLALFNFCQRFPDRARELLVRRNEKELDDPAMVAEHFTPSYDPWDQRLCAVPDADLFRSIKRGDAEVVTDAIDSFVPEGIRLRSGRVLEADVVVTATGLNLLPFGGIAPSVDGAEVDLSEQFVWQGAMLTGLPNFAVCMGYTNASWTLRADLTHRLVCRVLNYMERHDLAAAVPLPREELEERPLLALSSGYVQRKIAEFPRQGHRGPWRVRQNYILDSLTTMRRGLRGSMEFTPRSAVAESRRPRGSARDGARITQDPGAFSAHALHALAPRCCHGLAGTRPGPALHHRRGRRWANAAPAPYSAKITRTEHGIPHIVAKDFGSLGFGSGYAAAETSICTLADTVLTGRGQRSRYLGPNGKYDDQVSMTGTNLQADTLATDLHDRQVVEKLLASKAGPGTQARDMVAGYAAGVNAWLRKIGGTSKIKDPNCRGAAYIQPNATANDIWYGVYLANLIASTGHFLPQITEAHPPSATDPGSPSCRSTRRSPTPPSGCRTSRS